VVGEAAKNLASVVENPLESMNAAATGATTGATTRANIPKPENLLSKPLEGLAGLAGNEALTNAAKLLGESQSTNTTKGGSSRKFYLAS
jgi:hypothetical protein